MDELKKLLIEMLVTTGVLTILTIICLCTSIGVFSSCVMFFIGGCINQLILQTIDKMHDNIKNKDKNDE